MSKESSYMSKPKLFLLIVGFFLLLIGIRVVWTVVQTPPSGTPLAVRGELDLREFSLNNHDTISLHGDWSFYPNRFLMQEAELNAVGKEEAWVQVPGNWESMPPNNETKYGYGTYRLRILVDPEEEQLFSIRVMGIATSSELYVNGKLLEHSGRLAKSQQDYIASNKRYTATFMSKSGEIDIVIQVANYANKSKGGIYLPIKFGTDRAISKETTFSIAMQLIVIVVLAMHALYALLIYIFGTRQKVLFSFAGLVLSAILMVSTDDDKLLNQLIYISWEWSTKLQFSSLMCIGLFAIRFIRELLPDQMPIRLYRMVNLLNITVVLVILFQPFTISLIERRGIFCMMLLSFLIFTIITIRMVLTHVDDAVFLLLGIISVFLSAVGGLFKNFNWWEMGFYPIDLIIAFLASSSFWFRRYIRAAAQTVILSEKLQQEDKRKDDFLANVSHELRNPLHGILNIAQSVLDNENDVHKEKNIQSLTLLMTVGRRMSFMLNDLLDLTLLKEQGIQLQVKAVQVQTISTGVIDMLRFMTDGKPIRFDNQIPDLFPMVQADESRLIQILFNLLHNAVKYTNEGVITVRAQEKDGQAIISVGDTGIGITEEHQKKIFDPYEQGDSGVTSAGNGIGLGLSICKQLVELHEGSIKVNSVLDQGSVFSFTLKLSDGIPVVKEEEFELEQSETAASSEVTIILPTNKKGETIRKPIITADGDRPTIMIVDDDSVNRSVLQNILTAEGYEVTTASSGKQALSILDSREWDLIIADVMMPAMSGYELSVLIRERFTIAELPILLLTARSRPEDLQTGFLSGANDYVTKPLDATELRSRVRALTELKQSVRDQLRIEAAWLQAQIKPHFLFNTLNTIAALGDFDTTRMRSLLDVFGRYLKGSFDFHNSERLVSIEQELQLVRSYLYIEKERFEDRLQVRWEVEENLRMHIPPLTIQTLVENAVRHGILKRSQGGEIIIRISRIGDGAEVAIIDNGVGMDMNIAEMLLEGKSMSGSGIGLRNTDRRLKQIYGKGLQIQSEQGEGTKVAFLIRETTVATPSNSVAKGMKE